MNYQQAHAQFCGHIGRPPEDVPLHDFEDIMRELEIEWKEPLDSVLDTVVFDWLGGNSPRRLTPSQVVASYRRPRAWVELVSRGL